MKPVYLLLLLTVSAVSAADFHVDQMAAGAFQDGSAANPFRTIAQASAVLMPGDTCHIHAGVYRETLVPDRSGAAGAPIRYVAFNDEKVVISATEPVTGWQVHSAVIYKAENIDMSLGDKNMVYFETDAQQLARWPNDLDGDPYTFDAYKIRTESGAYSDSYITHNDIPDYWTSGVMFWLGAHSGCAVQRAITGYNSATNRLSFTPFPSFWPFGTHSPNRWENGHRGIFFLMGRLEALDAPSEWYYDSVARTLYFRPPGDADPSTADITIAARDRTLSIWHHHIEIDGLAFFGAPLQINGNDCKLTRLHVRHCVEGLITDEDSAIAGGAAVFVYADRLRIEQCLVEEGTATGITINQNADDTVVVNCVIRNFDKQGNHCSPIRANGPRTLITRNRIHGSARDVARSTGWDSVFSYNDVFDGLLANTDGGLFYVTGNSTPKNVELHHNWFHGAHSPDYTSDHSTGVYLDNDSAGFKVHHNVVWDVAWGGLHFNWDAVENEIYNNTFWDVGYDEEEQQDYAQILSWIPVRNGVPTDVQDNTIINNLSDVREWWDSGAGDMREDETLDNIFRSNVQVPEAPFISIDGMDFMLRNDGRLVDQGEIIPGITDGFVGAAPDIGAYEHGGEFWIPGPDWDPEMGPIGASDSKLVNLSVRTPLAESQNLIVGFVTEGGARDLLTRAVGPGLAGFVSGFHPDPQLQLFGGSELIDANDDWNADVATVMEAVGAFALSIDSRDACLVYPINGAATTHINGGGSGIVLLEVYDASDEGTSRIVNVSARNYVGIDDELLIAGFVIEGSQPRSVLIRGVGPTLADAPFNVSGVLQNPKIGVFDGDGLLVAENDQWLAPLGPVFEGVGAFPLTPGSSDAALRIVLEPGAYTVQVSGSDGGTGEGLVEVYALY